MTQAEIEADEARHRRLLERARTRKEPLAADAMVPPPCPHPRTLGRMSHFDSREELCLEMTRIRRRQGRRWRPFDEDGRRLE